MEGLVRTYGGRGAGIFVGMFVGDVQGVSGESSTSIMGPLDEI